MKRENNNISKLFGDEMKRNNVECNVKCNVHSESSKKTKIMEEIELKTVKNIDLSLKSGEITNPIFEKRVEKQQHHQDVLLSLLSEGSKEFKEKMGRNMSYSEMREMWG